MIPGPDSAIDLVELYICNPYPQASVSYDRTTPINQDVTATLTILTGNGIQNCSIINNAGSDQFLFTGDGSFTFAYTCTDRFLNVVTGSATATVSGIDKTLPTADIHYRFTLPTSGSVGVSLTGFSEPITITNNSGSDYYEFTSNGNFTFEFVDGAGNTGSRTVTVANIRPEYPIEDTYNSGLLVNQDEIDDWVRVFSGNKYCVYRTLTVDIGMNSYAVLPAWGCFKTQTPL